MSDATSNIDERVNKLLAHFQAEVDKLAQPGESWLLLGPWGHRANISLSLNGRVANVCITPDNCRNIGNVVELARTWCAREQAKIDQGIAELLAKSGF